MEYAVGIDVIEIARVRKVLQRHPDRFLQRVYTREEVAFCRGRVPELAARFAAKEAVMKALGVGLWKFAMRDVEVTRLPSGQPEIALHRRAAELAGERGVNDWLLTLTHTDSMAMAVAVALA
jgi:holo-[acyl-carrier protein] synthase